MVASVARGRAARREATRRRAQDAEKKRETLLLLVKPDDPSLSATPRDTGQMAATPQGGETAKETPTVKGDSYTILEGEAALNRGTNLETANDNQLSTAPPGALRLERAVTIDGTEVHLTADVKYIDGGGKPLEMLLVAVDKKARRSSRLALEATDIQSIVGESATQSSAESNNTGSGGGTSLGTREVFSAVVKALTVFNSRRNDLFILSYKGKKVVAPH